VTVGGISWGIDYSAEDFQRWSEVQLAIAIDDSNAIGRNEENVEGRKI